MRTSCESEYLLKAVDALNRQIIVVSPEHRILAANRYAFQTHGDEIINKRKKVNIEATSTANTSLCA